MRRIGIIFCSICMATSVFTGCNKKNVNDETTLIVAAAASLKNCYEEKLIPMYEKEHPGVLIEGTYDSSGKLQTQIEEGLEADVFMSAATKQMNALVEEQLIDKTSVVNLLQNELVAIIPADSSIEISEFNDITKAETIAIGDPESVPAGQYAKEALTNLGIWEEVSKKASLGTNVTEVLSWVEAASADVGIVYATDAASSDKVKVAAKAPEDSLKEPVIYPVGISLDGNNSDEAKSFIEFLQSDEALKVFLEYGFTVEVE